MEKNTWNSFKEGGIRLANCTMIVGVGADEN
jgi:hypothetical protein